jgi:hypothetical protein
MSITTTVPAARIRNAARRRSLSETLAPLAELVANSLHWVSHDELRFSASGETYFLPRYTCIGPAAGGRQLRIAVFAGIHGDEPEGVQAAMSFVKLLESRPELARGYSVTVYPVCNPTGFEDSTRHSRSGKDLNREFWRNSNEPEVRLLEAELVSHSFDGLIALHTDDTSEGFYGIVQGATLTRHLMEPALAAAEQILARDGRAIIDGFHARAGIVTDCYPGVLAAPPGARPRPFEIILESPAVPPMSVKVAALVAALQSILHEYREFIAYASDI